MRMDEILFGEPQGVVIVSTDPNNLHHVAMLSQEFNIHSQTIGVVTNDSKLNINDVINLERSKIESSYLHSLESTMKD